ncbi:LacI family DNA-binding transcriptional regulator [Halomonas huangheensis]|uniref:HTH lacI-type domain-containing protein n=1 Tax=Halomonas huangheensis TaxID=1178482 RepID=W1N9C4_9GAMM|nr:LacI family DNA-binding transcriptional regulator [Halomonas huangheensis]ALM53886.1 LacI family transcriptional regulator [Halomonas huangheensis]ERL52167.1 hypothetical protein BJB45_09380 [Halomonas huangheensis]
MKRKGTVTINDVARHVGLTNITVSRAFKQPDKVKPATRERIMEAARELGYVPNAFASQLRSSKSRLIGAVIASIDNPFYSEAIKAISREAKARGYDILLMDTDGDSDIEAAAIQTLLSYQVAGIILSPVSDALDYHPAYIETLRDAQLPLVMLDRTLPVEDFSRVVLDNRKAGWLIGNAMLKRKLDQALVLTGPANSYITQQRLQGLRDAYQQADTAVTLDPREGLYNFEPAYDAVMHYLSESGHPSAIVGLNQLMTLGALSALHDIGISYRDATVLGVDQLPYCSIFDIRIPTTRFDASHAGHQAIHLLLSRIANPDAPPQRVVIDCTME